MGATDERAPMKALFFEAYRTLTVRRTPVPDPGPGEVRLKVRYCGICGSDLSLYNTGALAGTDVILGHEISALVDLDPSGAWAPRTRVVPYPRGHGCGDCVWCLEGKPRYCLNPPAGTHGGGYAEYLVVPAESLIPVPDELDDRTAAVAEPLGVAVRGASMAVPRPGDFAYVSGLGPMGLFSVAALVASGCRVLGADPREDRRALGLEVGCESVLDPTSESPIGRALEFDRHGPRIAFECAGVTESLQQVFDLCAPQGVVAILGIPMGSVFLLRMTLKDLRAFSIQGPTMESMRSALHLLRAHPEIQKIVTGTVSLEGAAATFDRLVTGEAEGAKVLVAPNG